MLLCFQKSNIVAIFNIFTKMQYFSDPKSLEDNKLYKNKTVIFFHALEQCRLGVRADQEKLINNFKQLINPPSFPYGPLMAYLHVIYKNMTQDNLIIIRYLLSLDKSFLREILHYRNDLAKECFKHGSPLFFQFLHDDCGLAISYELALRNSCAFGNLSLVKYLVLDKLASVNFEDPYHLTILMLAVYSGKNEILDFLLKNHADVFMSTELGTVFHYAISKDKVISLCQLLAHVRDNSLVLENITDSQGTNVIHSAIKLKSSKQILQILSKFFDVNIKDDRGYDLLTYACLANNKEAAEYFSQNCAHLKYSAQVVNGFNVLHLCSMSAANNEIALWLVENNKIGIESQVNNNDKTALHLAVINNNYSLLDGFIKYIIRSKKKIIVNIQDLTKRHIGFYLLENPYMHKFLKQFISELDLDLLQKDLSGMSFLEYVIERKEFSILRECLIKVQSSNKKQKIKVSAVISSPNIIIQVLNFLIEELVEKPKSLDIIELGIDDWVLNGQTILHLVCLFRPINEIQEYIDKYSPDIEKRNADGQTIIGYLLLDLFRNSTAKANCCVDSVLESSCTDKTTPVLRSESPCILRSAESFDRSLLNGKIDVILSFIDLYNPNLINLDNQKSSLLHLACELQNIDLVKKGLMKKISATQKRNDFKSPLDIALEKADNVIFMMLWNSISAMERLDYCLRADQNTRQYLQDNNFYEISVDFILDIIQEEVLTADLLDLSLKIKTEEQSIFKYCDYLIKDIINETLQLIIEESAEEIVQQKLAVNDEITIIDNSPSELGLSEQDFLAAVTRRDYNFFRDIRDSAIYEHTLRLLAIELLSASIKTQDQQLSLFLLNFTVIEEQAHLHDNCILDLAKINKQSQVIERLLKIPKVQNNLFRYAQRETSLPGVLPVCWHNPKYQIVILKISNLLQKEKYKKINLFDYGSSIFKCNPKDLDLLIPNSNIDIDLIIGEFLEEFCALGASITVTDAYEKPGYCSPRKNPVRRVIPIVFLNCKLEIVLSSQSIVEHAYSLLTTVTAAYFNIRELQMYVIPGINTFEHMRNMTLDTVIEPDLSFSIDFTRVLRLLIMLASCPGFKLSTRCFNAIFSLFSGDSNLFLSNNYNYQKLHLQLSELFSCEHTYNSLFIMYKLKVLPKLIDFLFIKKDEVSRIYGQRLFEWHETMISAESDINRTYDKLRGQGGFSI